MATLRFQASILGSHRCPQQCNVNGDIKRDHFSKFATPGVNARREISIKVQVSGLRQPASAVEDYAVLEAGEGLELGEERRSTERNSLVLRDQQKQWERMLNDIRKSGDAVPVLAKLKKAKRLTRETILGTLVRLKQLRAWKSVMEICEWLMGEDWWEFGFEDYCLLMVAYGKGGQPEKAETLLASFLKAGYKSNIAIQTGLLEAYGKKRMFSKAESIFKSLLESGPAPTVLTYQTLMKAYTEDDRIEDAERIFLSMTGGVKADGRCYNLMIHAYRKARMYDKAYNLYQEMRRLQLDISVVTYNTLLTCQQNTRDVESIFRQMRAAKVRPDVFSYTTLMKSYVKSKRPEDVQDKFDEMVACGIRPTVTTYNVLLDAYAKARQVEDAETVLKKMRKDKCTPTVHSFTTMVHAYTLVGKMSKAEEILKRMKGENVTPNMFTFSSIMSGYALVKDYEKMMKTFHEMKTIGLQPNEAVYTVVIGALGDAEDFEACKFWFKQMVLSGCVVDQRAKHALLNASKNPDQLKEASALVETAS